MEGFGAGLRFSALGRGGWRVVGLRGGFWGWLEVGGSWVEVGEQFSTTQRNQVIQIKSKVKRNLEKLLLIRCLTCIVCQDKKTKHFG